jgi:hypothetical protein
MILKIRHPAAGGVSKKIPAEQEVQGQAPAFEATLSCSALPRPSNASAFESPRGWRFQLTFAEQVGFGAYYRPRRFRIADATPATRRIVKLKLAGSGRYGRSTYTGGGFETLGMRLFPSKSNVPRFCSDRRR